MIQTAIKKYLATTNCNQLNIKGVMFDMDGVIFNSMPLHAKSWVKAFADCGIKFTEYQVYLNEGRTGAATVDEQFLKYFGKEGNFLFIK